MIRWSADLAEHLYFPLLDSLPFPAFLAELSSNFDLISVCFDFDERCWHLFEKHICQSAELWSVNFLTWINLCSEFVSISSLFKFFCLNIDPSWSSFYVYYSYFDFGTLMLLAKIGVIHLVFKPCMFILVFCVTSPNTVRPKETVFDEKWFLVQKYTVVTKWCFKIW